MGLLDWFRRRGAPGAGSTETTDAHPVTTSPPDTAVEAATEAAHGAGVPTGSPAEGPPVGVSDPGSLTGEDQPFAAEQEDELEPGADRPV